MDKIEELILKRIEENAEKIISFADDIYEHPELGFKETRTAEVVESKLKKLGMEIKNKLAITGVKGYLKEKERLKSDEAISIAIVGELDAIRSPEHEKADPITGAAHACGHNAQLAALYGAAIALSDDEIKKSLGGNVIFFAVPSEEYGEIEFKDSLRRQGLIEFLGGKSELIRIGEFDEIDMVLYHHSLIGESKNSVFIRRGSSNGFVSKLVKYKGKEAHAGLAPHEGINALNAAVLGLSAVNFQRETFKDSDSVRVHSIITKGGGLVNVVPGEVVIETLVRAKSIEAILDANSKTNRAFKSGAAAIGAEIEISDLPGYLPRLPQTLETPILDIAKELVGENEVAIGSATDHTTGSSDIGDITHILPTFEFATAGMTGNAHSSDVKIVDKDKAYILPAKIMALSAYRLLKEKALKAKEIKEEFKPKFTKEEYINYMNSIIKS